MQLSSKNLVSILLRLLPVIISTCFLLYLSSISNLLITNSKEYEFIIRKIGHALAYGTLFLSAWHSFSGHKFFASFYSLFIASTDEFIQKFYSWGRHGTIQDIAIDMFGVSIFMFIFTDVWKKNKVMVIGGGTGGHSIPAIIIAKSLQEEHIDVVLISEINGLTKSLANKEKIKCRSIIASRPRIYSKLSLITAPITLILSIVHSILILAIERPKVIFAKGGFLSIPIGIASILFRIPLFLHESDVTPSKSLKILRKIAVRTFHGLGEDKNIDGQILDQIFDEYNSTKTNNQKPIILITGGSLGAEELNNAVNPDLLQDFEIYHQHGKTIKPKATEGYHPAEFFDPETMRSLLLQADLVVSRAGSTTLGEISALGKRAIILPLRHVGRLDQPANARIFAKDRIGTRILDANPDGKTLLKNILEVLQEPSPVPVKQRGRQIVLQSLKHVLLGK